MSRYDNTLWEELIKNVCLLNLNLFLVMRVYHYVYVHIILIFFKTFYSSKDSVYVIFIRVREKLSTINVDV